MHIWFEISALCRTKIKEINRRTKETHKKNPTHEKHITIRDTGRWQRQQQRAHNVSVSVNGRIFRQFIKCHLLRFEFEFYLSEKQKQIPFYLKFLSRVSTVAVHPLPFTFKAHKYDDKTFLCSLFHFNYVQYFPFCFLCSGFFLGA